MQLNEEGLDERRESIVINYGDGLESSKVLRQSQGVVSRLNPSYFCEIRYVTILENEFNSSQVKGMIIDFNFRCDCSMGPSEKPIDSKLYIRRVEFPATKCEIKQKTFNQVIGSITFLLPLRAYIEKDLLIHSNVKFRYGDSKAGYSKVHLLMPNQDDNSCPHCNKNFLRVSDDDNEVFDCNNCHRIKEGKHWHCDYLPCLHDYCFECLCAVSADKSCRHCSKGEIKEFNSVEEIKTDDLTYCDNCRNVITMDKSLVSSHFTHCQNCNFNLCRACSFHPNRDYADIYVDTFTDDKFELKLSGHTDGIFSIHIASDSSIDSCLMISASKDNTAIVWDMNTGWMVTKLTGHKDWVRAGIIIYVTDITEETEIKRPYAVTGGDDRVAHVWDIHGDISDPICSFHGHSEYIYAIGYFDKLHINALSHNNDNDSNSDTIYINDAVITGGGDGFAYVWDVRTGEEYDSCRVELEEEIYSLLIVPNTKDEIPRVVFGTPTRAVLYELNDTSRPWIEYSTFGTAIEFLKIFTDELKEDILLLGSDRCASSTALVWSLNTGICIYTISGPSKLSSITVYNDLIIAGCVDGEVPVWGKEKRLDKKRYAPNQANEITAISVYEYTHYNQIKDTKSQKAIYKKQMLVIGVDNISGPSIVIIHLGRIGDVDAPITTVKDITVDIPINVFTQGLTKSVIITLEKERTKKIIACTQVTLSCIPLMVVATATKFSVIDFYTGVVVFEHIFVKLICTAMSVISDNDTPIVVCGGNINPLFQDITDKMYGRGKEGIERLNHVVKMWNINTGQLVGSYYWETAIDSMISALDVDGNPIVVTAGLAAFHHKVRRIVYWDVKRNEKTIRNAKEYGNDSSQVGLDRQSGTPSKVAKFAFDILNGKTRLIEISGSGLHRVGITMSLYSLPSLSSIKTINKTENMELWTTFRLNNAKTTKLIALLPPSVPTESEKNKISQKLNGLGSFELFTSRKILVVDLEPKKEESERFSTYLLSMKESTDHFYLINACGEKDLEYVVFVSTIDKFAESNHTSKNVSPRASNFDITQVGILTEELTKTPYGPSRKSLEIIPSERESQSSSQFLSPSPTKSQRVSELEPEIMSLSSKNLKAIQAKNPYMTSSKTINRTSVISEKPSEKQRSEDLSIAEPFRSGRCKVSVYDVRSKKCKYELKVSAKVSSVHIFQVSKWIQKEPLIVLTCEDGVVLTWNFTKKPDQDNHDVHIKRFREGVKEKHDDEFWIKKMTPDSILLKMNVSEWFDFKYWLNNQKIMYEAADRKVESFIKQMQKYAYDHVYVFTRALDMAIINKNPRLVKLYLDYWVKLLNKEVSNKVVTQDWFHRPSVFLHMNTLLKLSNEKAKVFHKEFANFICQIKLLKSPPDVKDLDESWEFQGNEVLAGGSAIYGDAINVWRNKFKSSSRQSIEAYFLPLKDAAHIEMLQAYVTVCEQLDNVSIFNSPVGIYATKYAWQEFGLRIHLQSMMIYLIFHSVFTASIFNFESWRGNNIYSQYVVAYLLEIIVGLFLLFYLYEEIIQIPFVHVDYGARVASIQDAIENYQPVTKMFVDKVRIITNISKTSIFYYPSLPILYLWNGFWGLFLIFAWPIDKILSRFFILIECNVAFMCSFLGFGYSILDDMFISRDYYELIVGYNNTVVCLYKVIILYFPCLAIKVLWNTSCYLLGFVVVTIFKLLLCEFISIPNLRIVIKHFSNFWNIIDILIIGMGLPGTILRLVYQDDNEISKSLLAIASMCSWMKILYYLRPFEVSGRLVSTILEMAYQIRFFILILSIVMMAFAQAFWLLSHPNSLLPYGSVKETLLNTFLLAFGQYPDQDAVYETANPEMLFTLIVLFTLVVTILMLNLLIALMSDAYGKIRDNGIAQWRFEQATIILEENRTMPSGKYQPYVHVLKTAQIDIDNELDDDGNNSSSRENSDAIHEISRKLMDIEFKLDEIIKSDDPPTINNISTTIIRREETDDYNDISNNHRDNNNGNNNRVINGFDGIGSNSNNNDNDDNFEEIKYDRRLQEQ